MKPRTSTRAIDVFLGDEEQNKKQKTKTKTKQKQKANKIKGTFYVRFKYPNTFTDNIGNSCRVLRKRRNLPLRGTPIHPSRPHSLATGLRKIVEPENHDGKNTP